MLFLLHSWTLRYLESNTTSSEIYAWQENNTRFNQQAISEYFHSQAQQPPIREVAAATALNYLQSHERIPSKTPLAPKKSCSPVLRSAILER